MASWCHIHDMFITWDFFPDTINVTGLLTYHVAEQDNFGCLTTYGGPVNRHASVLLLQTMAISYNFQTTKFYKTCNSKLRYLRNILNIGNVCTFF